MTVVFPSLESLEFSVAWDTLHDNLAQLEALWDQRGVISGGNPDDDELTATILSWNALMDELQPIRTYIHALVTTDATDAVAQGRYSQMHLVSARLSKLWSRFAAWVRDADLTAWVSEPTVTAHQYVLKRTQIEARHQMSPAEEDLAADLRPTGSSAWGQLHGEITARLNVVFQHPTEGVQELPMAVLRGLAYDFDPAVRREAHKAELEGWKAVEVPLASAMNAIKGEVNTLTRRRGWGSPLDESLFGSSIDRATLDAMLGAARNAFPAFRRYLRAKAKALGHEGSLPWYDLFASVGTEDREWSYQAGAEFVSRQFHLYSPRMGALADRCFAEDWVHARPQPGKRDGAYCMGLRSDESRVLMTWKPSFGSVSTLAHELGHAYHNLCLASRTAMQSETPMTLAETASIFCETIVSQAVLDDPATSKGTRLNILEQSLQRATQTVVDISSRYLFEAEIFERRPSRTLTADELCEAMLSAQEKTYGQGLSEVRHPFMWAVKGHYYSGGRSFYNYPYMFGHLFSLGLYAIFRRDPEDFRARYDDLLSSTGLSDARTLAGGFGLDIASGEFWDASLATIAEDIDRFVAEVGA